MSKLAPTIGTRGTLRQCRRWDQQVPSIIHDSRQESGSVMDDSGGMRQRGMQHTSSLSHQVYTATHQCFHHFMMSISKDRSEQSSAASAWLRCEQMLGGKINGGCPVLVAHHMPLTNHISPLWTGIKKKKAAAHSIVEYALCLAVGPNWIIYLHVIMWKGVCH